MGDGVGRPLERGPCTLIVARPGPVDPSKDMALIEALEREARLPAGTLCRTSAMDAREFRLLEGVSRPVADRIARVASRAGYQPRVRDRLGIRWSSERGTEMAVWFGAAWVLFGVAWSLGFPLVDAVFGPAGRVPALLVAIPALGLALGSVYRWQLGKLYMPLVVSAFALPAPVAGPLADAAHQALDSVGRLARALDGGALPAFAAEDLRPVVRHLRAQIRRRVREARALDERAREVLDGLQRRMAALPEDAAGEEVEGLVTAIDRAEGQEAERELARAVYLEDLDRIRSLADEARCALEAHDPDLEAVERLRRLADSQTATAARNEASNRSPVVPLDHRVKA